MLILASASPRRHELLLAAGIDHVVQPTSVPEDRLPREPPIVFVRRIAETKARAANRGAPDIVLAADTVVCVDAEVFGKPASGEEAGRMLRLLSGRDHWVHTGICLLSATRCVLDVASTKVSLVPLSEDDIQEYIRSGEPSDKAGAYAIQGRASRFVSSLEGSYSNVVGLPVALVYRYLKDLESAPEVLVPPRMPEELQSNPSAKGPPSGSRNRS